MAGNVLGQSKSVHVERDSLLDHFFESACCMGAELARVGVVRMRHVDGGSVKCVRREVKVWEGALVVFM
jgi:hypothetical protein